MHLQYQLVHKGRIVALVVNKSMACAVIHAYDGVHNDAWELKDLEGRSVPKLFGKGPMSARRGIDEHGHSPNGGAAKVSWGPEGW